MGRAKAYSFIVGVIVMRFKPDPSGLPNSGILASFRSEARLQMLENHAIVHLNLILRLYIHQYFSKVAS